MLAPHFRYWTKPLSQVMPDHSPRAAARLPYLLLVALWLLLHLCLVGFHSSPLLSAELAGPDSYMRLVRVTELLQGGGWFDSTLSRSNAPFGEDLHWTRPFDVLLLALATPLAAFGGWQSGLFWAGAAVSPLLQLATGLVFIWASRPLLPPNRWFLPIIALFLQPAALAYAVPGRVDHHVLLLLVFMATLGCMLRALAAPGAQRPALAAGGLVGFGLWLSVEQLLVMVACLLGFGLAWILTPRERARQGFCFALGVSAVVVLALLCERPPAALLTVAYDRISVVHLAASLAALGIWAVALQQDRGLGQSGLTWQRLAFLLLGGLGTAAALQILFPAFFTGPMANVDPRILPIWLGQVTEMRAVLPIGRVGIGEFIYYFGSGLLVAPLLLYMLWHERADARWLSWLFLACAIVLFWLVAVRHIRFAPYAELLFVVPLAELFERVLARADTIASEVKRGLLRGTAISVLLVGSIGLGTHLMNAEGEANAQNLESAAQRCDLAALARHLEAPQEGSDNGARQDDRPLTILALLDFGPELLYRTRHRVIATPYHRNGDGIYDSHRMLTTADEAEARRGMAARGVDVILLCPGGLDPAFFTAANDTGGLYNRLQAGVVPTWLQAVFLPEGLAEQFQVFRVNP